MVKSAERLNPFYVVLLPVGAAFCLTAIAYVVMMFRASRPGMIADADQPHPLIVFMEQYGLWLLLGELALLAICTVGAIGTDSYWSRPKNDSR
jgi:hypothetical protein